MTFDKAVEASAENAWALQQAMVAYSASFTAPSKTKKNKATVLKTRKGGKWNKLFKEVLDLFAAFDWSVVRYKFNEHIESWTVTSKDGNQAVLYLDSNGFTLGGKKPGDILTGEFEGYEMILR